MGKRRWISVSVTNQLSYWTCPGGCKTPMWNTVFPQKIECKNCRYNYVALQTHAGRLLIEVPNEDQRSRPG